MIVLTNLSEFVAAIKASTADDFILYADQYLDILYTELPNGKAPYIVSSQIRGKDKVPVIAEFFNKSQAIILIETLVEEYPTIL